MAADDVIRVAGTAVVLRDGVAGPEVLLLRRPSSGSFPGAWVFPGGRVDPGDEDDALSEMEAARAAAVRETAEEAGIRIGDLTAISRWTPPEDQPARYRTWFFLAADLGDEVRANRGEIEEAVWMTPARALAEHATGGLRLFPPTWVTLNGLVGCGSVREALSTAGEPEFFTTVMGEDSQGAVAMWAGDERHPETGAATGSRHRLRMSSLPWIYERS